MTENEIVNKVAESGLIQFDLEALYPAGERTVFDLKNFLFEELVLKEKNFREQLKKHDWNSYQDKYVALTCSADAIVPTWAFMLVASMLEPVAKKIVFGDLKKLEEEIFRDRLSKINPEDYRDQRVVIKGCSKVEVPAAAYVELTSLLRPVVKSILYGEPCSTVPVYKSSVKSS